MQLVEFYRGERGNNVGVTLEQMLQFSHGEMEMDHDYIQWMFPTNEASMFNSEAPTLTQEESKIFQVDPDLKSKVRDSFIKFLDFIGMRINGDGEFFFIESQDSTEDRHNPLGWLEHFNHNMLRVTRVLKSLRLLGLTEEAIMFYEALTWHKEKVSANTWKYWTDAVVQPLW